MKAIITVVEKVTSEAHIEIPDGLSEPEIRQHIVDLYNSGEMHVDLNIYQADFESISAKIIKTQAGSSGIILRPGNESDRLQGSKTITIFRYLTIYV